MFANFSNCMPGDSLTQTICVKADSANGAQGAKVYLRAEIDGDTSAMHEQKAAGAVGVLRLARMEAALAEERRLLVARHAADGNALDEPRVRRHAEAAGRGAHLGKDGLGDAEELKQEGIPASSRNARMYSPMLLPSVS